MRAIQKLTLIVFAFPFAACGTSGALTQQGRAVAVSDENIVRTCQFLGDVSGESTDTETARNRARNQAAKLGATNVMFVSQTPSTVTGPESANISASAMGRAYRCPGTPSSAQ
jgi:hypothetical protein